MTRKNQPKRRGKNSVSDGDRGDDNADMPLYNLQGQQVKNAGKGIFVRKNKKIIIQYNIYSYEENIY